MMRGWILAAVTVILVTTIAGVVAISIFATNTEYVAQVIAMVVPTLAALSALLSSASNSRKLDENISKTEEVHKVVANGSGNGNGKH